MNTDFSKAPYNVPALYKLNSGHWLVAVRQRMGLGRILTSTVSGHGIDTSKNGVVGFITLNENGPCEDTRCLEQSEFQTNNQTIIKLTCSLEKGHEGDHFDQQYFK